MARTKYTAKKYQGDDTYSWAVFANGMVMSHMTGLNRSQARYYINLLTEVEIERAKEAKQ